MARRNISLPDDLDDAARSAQLNVSALAQAAVRDELNRRARMQHLDSWLDELDASHRQPSKRAQREAESWAASATPVGATRQQRAAS